MSESGNRIQLLVSVRNAREAMVAFEAGVDIVDIKEPARGPMGRADFRVIEDILTSADLPPELPRTVALGELVEGQLNAHLRKLMAIGGATIVKVGFSKITMATHLLKSFAQSAVAARPYCELAPVFYADHLDVGCPRFDLLLDVAQQAGCRTMVVDTFVKDGRKLWNWLSPDVLAWMVVAASGKGMQLAAAGSLSPLALQRMEVPFPAIVGVRGCVCRNGRRDGVLDGEMIRQFKNTLQTLGKPQDAAPPTEGS